MILTDEAVAPAAFEAGTGWSITPQGACRADLCVLLPPDAATTDRVDVDTVAARLGMPVVRDETHGVAAVGPETSVSGKALSSAVAPDLTLPDFDGRPFELASLRGQKVILLAWASW